MGNTADKTHGGRGADLGKPKPNPSTTTNTKKKKNPFKKKPKPPVHHPVYHSKDEQRAARANLVVKKKKNVQSELNKKQKMLHVLAAADAKKNGTVAPPAPVSSNNTNNTNNTTNVSGTGISPVKSKSNNKSNKTSLYMADPSSKQALAAEQRIQTKTKTKKKSNKPNEERKKRTMDLLFGDALNTTGNDDDNNNVSASPTNTVSPKPKPKSKAANTVYVANTSSAAAALERLNKNKSNRIINMNDRKNRTMALLHGNMLQSKDEVKAKPKQKSKYNDVDPDVASVHQSVLNLNNLNPHDKMPTTAKLLKKVVANILGAVTISDKEKFGKLRLTNKKIKAAIVDIQYGIETLQSMGFKRKQMMNDKEHKMDDYMVFDWNNVNRKALLHLTDLLNEYYPNT